MIPPKEGDPRRASALLARSLAPRPLRHPAGALPWLAGPLAVDDPADMLTTMAAVLAFDAEPGLQRVRAPTLVAGGSADPCYSKELAQLDDQVAGGEPEHVLQPGEGQRIPVGQRRQRRDEWSMNPPWPNSMP